MFQKINSIRKKTLSSLVKYKLIPTILSSAVAFILYVPAVDCAEQNTSYSIKTYTPKQQSGLDKKKQVLDFTNKTLQTMKSKATFWYLKNNHVANVATFPAKLLSVQKQNVWQSSPNHGLTEQDRKYYYGVPSYRKPEKFDPDTTPIYVESDQVFGDLNNKKDDLTYYGNVIVSQADNTITTDKLHYKGSNQTFKLTGSTLVSTPEYTLSTQKPVISNLKNKTIELEESQMQMNGSYVRGESQSHKIDRANGKQTLKKTSLTSCPIDNNSWHFSSTSVYLDENEPFGEAWNSTVWLGYVPVMYMPYLKFPTTSKRQSGVLYPKFSIGSNGLYLDLPIYFNLAPNYDWTFTPAWAGDHHWKFDNQFRYMPFENVTGEIKFTYLHDDPSWSTTDYRLTSYNQYKGDNTDRAPSGGYKRWFLNINQTMWFLDRDLTFTVDYSRVRPNDYNYISDILDTNAAVTDDHLIQSFKGAYSNRYIDVSTEVRKYQSLIDPRANVIAPFALMPQVKASYTETFSNLLLSLDTEFSRFSQDEYEGLQTFSSERTHIEPSIKYHIFDQRGTTLDAGAKLFYTHYNQGDINNLPNYFGPYLGYADIAENKDRLLYLLELRGKTTFERKVIDMNHTQTLEPEIKYQYIPYEDQNDIALYDTTDRLDDFYTLFSYKRFAGIDRIANLNTLSLGVTSRLLDAHDREIMRLGIAQAYNFEPTKVTLNARDHFNDYPRSPLAFMFDATPFEIVNFHTSGTYNTEDTELNALRLALRYENEGYIAGVSYRFVNQGNVEIGDTEKNRDLRQIGAELALPITDNVKFVSALYRDLEQNYNIDKKLALRYQDSCFAVTLVYEDYMLMDWNNYSHDNDRVIGLQFELKGFYALDVHGIDSPSTTDTHFIPSTDPVNLNR